MPDSELSNSAELRRRLKLLRQELDAGKIQFAPHLAERMRRSLAAVQLGDDGEIDLGTVSPEVRSMALAIAAMHDREELKGAMSLVDIQARYFGWVDSNFGSLFKTMIERRLGPVALANGVASNQEARSSIMRGLPDFIEATRDFWSNTADIAYAHVEDGNQLKGVFGGDLFPASGTNIASRCGIYVDTIVVPDPFLRIAGILSQWQPEKQVAYIVKHALNVLKYRELALAGVDPPILVVLPDRHFFDEEEQTILHRVAEPDVVDHFNTLFGSSFGQLDELRQFADGLPDVDAVLRHLVQPERLLFDTAWTGSPSDQLTRAFRERAQFEGITPTAGTFVMMQALGRMHQANDLLLKSQVLRGTPLIDAPTSWQYLQWKLGYDTARLSKERSIELHVTQALLSASGTGELAWLGNVPPEALIQLRQENALPELRSLLADGVQKLTAMNPEDFRGTGDLVLANMRLAFAEHQQKVEALARRKWRFGLSDIGSWLVIGGVEVVAAATGSPTYGLVAIAADQLLDVPKLKELPGKFRKLVADGEALKRSPVGLLFKHRG
jgi:hypothetical protein